MTMKRLRRFGISPGSSRIFRQADITRLARLARGKSPDLDAMPELRPTEISISKFIIPETKRLELVDQGLIGIIMRNARDAKDTSLLFLRGVKIGLGSSISHDNRTNLLVPGASQDHADIVFEGPNTFLVVNNSDSPTVIKQPKTKAMRLAAGAKVELTEKSVIRIGDHTLSVVCLRGRSLEPPSKIQHPGSFAVLEVWDLRYGRRNLAVVSGKAQDQVAFQMNGSCASILPTNNVTGINAAIKFQRNTLAIRDYGKVTQIDGNKCDDKTWVDLKEGQVVHVGRFNVVVVNAIHGQAPKMSGVCTSTSVGYHSLELFLRNPEAHSLDPNLIDNLVAIETKIYRSFGDSEKARNNMMLKWVKIMQIEFRRISAYPEQKDRMREYEKMMGSVDYLFTCGASSTDPMAFFDFVEKNKRALDLAIAAKRLTLSREKAPVFEKVKPSWKQKSMRSAIVRCIDGNLPIAEQLLEILDKIPEELMGDVAKPEQLQSLIRAGNANILQAIELMNKILNPVGVAIWRVHMQGKKSQITVGEVHHMASTSDEDTVIVTPIKKLPNLFTIQSNGTRAGIQFPFYGTIMINGSGKAGSHDKSFRYHIQRYMDELSGFSAKVQTVFSGQEYEAEIRREATALAASYLYSNLKNHVILDELRFASGGRMRQRAARLICNHVEDERGNVRSALVSFINKQYKEAENGGADIGDDFGNLYSSLLNTRSRGGA